MIDEVAHIQQLILVSIRISVALDNRAWYNTYRIPISNFISTSPFDRSINR
jgi:hypothetical protein